MMTDKRLADQSGRCPSPEDSSLEDLHEWKMTCLDSDSEAQMSYLLSCQTFLKENDRSGWISHWAPDLITDPVEPAKKRLRMSPGSLIWSARAPCVRCKSKEIVEDVKEGSVVCTACGMIQDFQLLTSENGAHTSVDRKNAMDRFVVHRYSRVVYFRSFLQSMQGLTDPQYTPSDLLVLRQALGGLSVISPDDVQRALRVTNLTKFRRHKERLAEILSDGAYKAPVIPADVFYKLLKLFRRVEYYWEGGMKTVLKERRVFLSYPYVFYQLCFHLGLPSLSGSHHLLKSKPRLQLLHKVYGRLCKKASLKCDLDAFRPQ
jgi:hypothetical protein